MFFVGECVHENVYELGLFGIHEKANDIRARILLVDFLHFFQSRKYICSCFVYVFFHEVESPE